MKGIILFTLLFLFLAPQHVGAGVIFNEVYPAPETGAYEWIELYNDSANDINLSDYELYDVTGKKMLFDSLLFKSQTYLIATAEGVLNNGGDSMFLKDNAGAVIETLTYPSSITAPASYARCPTVSGLFTKVAQETMRLANTSACPTASETPQSPSPTGQNPLPTSSPVPSGTIGADFNNIFISEVMVNPDLGDLEWVELFNNNGFAVNLQSWSIDDIAEGGSAPIVFSAVIPAQSHAVVELNTAIFNNSGDHVRLLNRSGLEQDEFIYTESARGISYGRISFSGSLFCQQEATKGTANDACSELESETGPSPSTTINLATASQTEETTEEPSQEDMSEIPIHRIVVPKQKLVPTVIEEEIPKTLHTANKKPANNLPLQLSVTSSSLFFSITNVVYSVYKLFLVWKNDLNIGFPLSPG